MLTCKEATRLISESLDRDLPFRRRLGLRIHLVLCRLCRRYARQLFFLQTLLRNYGRTAAEEDSREGDDDAPGLSPEAQGRIRERLRDRRSPS